MGTFSDPILGGRGSLIRDEIRSPDFASDPEDGVTGWRLGADGTIVAKNVTIGSESYSVDGDGNATFETLSVNATDILIGGTPLSEMLNNLPRGVVVRAIQEQNSATTSGGTEIGVFEFSIWPEDGRMYRITSGNLIVKGSVVGDQFSVRLRESGTATPTVTHQILQYLALENFAANSDRPSVSISLPFTCDASRPESISNLLPGQHRILLTLMRLSGTGTGSISTGTPPAYNPVSIVVEDIGPLIPDTRTDNDGGGAPVAPVQRYISTYPAWWSASYSQAGSRVAVDGELQRCGNAGSGSSGNQRAIIGFPFAQIQADLAGAIIEKCEVYLYFEHWWYSNGGTARIGTHSSTHTADNGPATYPAGNVSAGRVTVTGWKRNEGRWVSLGTGIGGEFRSGATCGIAVGPGASSDVIYYGKFRGDNQSSEPVLRITYTK